MGERAELEKMLLEDEEFRAFLANLRETAREADELEARFAKARQKLHQLIRDLVDKYGIPKAFIARQVGLSPQRINSILHEGQRTQPVTPKQRKKAVQAEERAMARAKKVTAHR